MSTDKPTQKVPHEDIWPSGERQIRAGAVVEDYHRLGEASNSIPQEQIQMENHKQKDLREQNTPECQKYTSA